MIIPFSLPLSITIEKDRFTLCVRHRKWSIKDDINFKWKDTKRGKSEERIWKKKCHSIYFNYMKFEQSRSANCIIILAFEIVFSIFLLNFAAIAAANWFCVGFRNELQWLWVLVFFPHFLILFSTILDASWWFDQTTRIPKVNVEKKIIILIAKL